MASWLRCSRAGCSADDGATDLARRQGLDVHGLADVSGSGCGREDHGGLGLLWTGSTGCGLIGDGGHGDSRFG
ncbi:hypothetical protein M0R45_010439 [Rubus argutus]|uniref:MHC class I antigen n=1 Tax=Rubus argutus TaxID=59490 RepID=A0AAW1YAX9_RUBAR